MVEVHCSKISVLLNQITTHNNREVIRLYNQRCDKLEFYVRMYGFKIDYTLITNLMH